MARKIGLDMTADPNSEMPDFSARAPVGVLFVCLGNICRSPTAEGVFRSQVQEAGLDKLISIDSAGTGDWHIGHSPDPRAIKHGLEAGYDITELRARQVSALDFPQFNYLIAMDRQNLLDLELMRPDDFTGYLGLLLDLSPAKGSLLAEGSLSAEGSRDVPDPYTLDAEGFRRAIKLIESGCANLLRHIIDTHPKIFADVSLSEVFGRPEK